MIDRLEHWGLIAGAPRGVYPWFGSVYPGGGFAAGAGVRKPFGDDGAVNVFGGYSITAFCAHEADAGAAVVARGRAAHGVGTLPRCSRREVLRHRPRLEQGRQDLFRLHADERRRTARRRRHQVFARWAAGSTIIDIERPLAAPGLSIEERFSPADTPGSSSKFNYINSTARAAFDWRRRLGYSGTADCIASSSTTSASATTISTRSVRVEAEVLQLIPILRANWVSHCAASPPSPTSMIPAPFPSSLLPSLGGGNDLRGYPDFRFRDRHRLLMNAELRWTPARFIDMALFYDAGKVAARREDLDFGDLEDSYGIGMRMIGPEGYAFRARSGAQPGAQRASHLQRGRSILTMASTHDSVRDRCAPRVGVRPR